MKSFILATKKETVQDFDEQGIRIPVTLLDTQDCYLLGLREKEIDGYDAAIVGFLKAKKVSKPVSGFLKKSGIKQPLSYIREFLLDKNQIIEKSGKKGIKLAEKEIFCSEPILASEIFSAKELVKVTGISKGKGFAGVVKRHGFAGGPRTHGQSDRERAPGSIGQSTTPGRVYKGKRMAGRMGSDKITISNLTVVASDEKFLKVKGLVPGARGGLLKIQS